VTVLALALGMVLELVLAEELELVGWVVAELW